MKATKILATAAVMMAILAGRVRAEHPVHGPVCEDPSGPPKCKQCGKKACYSEVEKVKVKKVVYDVECKDVCIPKLSLFSLFRKKCDADCTPQCGKVRRVRVLVRKEIECEECKCKWNIVDCPEPCHVGCPAGGCGAPVYMEGAPIIMPGTQVLPGTSMTPGTVMPYTTGQTVTPPSSYAPELIAAPKR